MKNILVPILCISMLALGAPVFCSAQTIVIEPITKTGIYPSTEVTDTVTFLRESVSSSASAIITVSTSPNIEITNIPERAEFLEGEKNLDVPVTYKVYTHTEEPNQLHISAAFQDIVFDTPSTTTTTIKTETAPIEIYTSASPFYQNEITGLDVSLVDGNLQVQASVQNNGNQEDSITGARVHFAQKDSNKSKTIVFSPGNISVSAFTSTRATFTKKISRQDIEALQGSTATVTLLFAHGKLQKYTAPEPVTLPQTDEVSEEGSTRNVWHYVKFYVSYALSFLKD